MNTNTKKKEASLIDKRKRRKYNMSGKKFGHIFIIGIIGEKKIEAIKTYNIKTKECTIESVESLKKRIVSGEKVIGASVKYSLRYNVQKNEYTIRASLIFDNSVYRCKSADILNGKGEIIIPGKEVIIGMIESKDSDIYIAMNGNAEQRYVNEKDAIDQQLRGVTYKENICYKSCQNIL